MGICRHGWKYAPAILAMTAMLAGRVAAQDVLTRDLTRTAEEPRLRIHTNGHTAVVRALAFTPDSRRLCSGSLDKCVQVWNLSTLGGGVIQRDLFRAGLKERTIRWEVARGPRGSIYALASAPDDGLLAMGGYGARGSLGDIWLVDPITGEFRTLLAGPADDPRAGHAQSVAALTFSSDGAWLASADFDGKVILWRRGEWKPDVLFAADVERYGNEAATFIAGQPKRRPIVTLGDRHLVVPQYDGHEEKVPKWKLAIVDVNDRENPRTLSQQLTGVVTALAATPDGRMLAAADLSGKLFLWDLAKDDRVVELKPERVVSSLAISPDHRTLVVGTALFGAKQNSQLQVWDIGDEPFGAKIGRTRSTDDHVQACAVSPDGRWIAYTGGVDHEIFVEPVKPANEKATVLAGSGRRVFKVAFAKEKPFYRVAFGTTYKQEHFNEYGPLEESFDPVALEVSADRQPKGDWLDTNWLSGTWRAKPNPRDSSLQLARDGRQIGNVPPDPRRTGRARCYTWISDARGTPLAIAVGTDVSNGIYVYRLSPDGRFELSRYFRGHEDYVTSLSVSRDLRYLASGSADGTVRYWSLKDYQRGNAPPGRWGVTLTVVDGQLQVSEINEVGPLYRKGMRKGDFIKLIRWREGDEERQASEPEEVLDRLTGLKFEEQVVFETTRNGRDLPAFQAVGAWQPLATLFPAKGREWAFWTPEGYYDASANGHRLFGWLVNRGRDRMPSFYRADQFRKRLERPDVMKKLLAGGSLVEAFRQAAQAAPDDAHSAIESQIALAPSVTILSPSQGTVLRGTSAKITARVEMPSDRQLVRAKAYTSGVVATNRRLVAEEMKDDKRIATYEWDAALPTEPRGLIQVVVGTDVETAAFDEVIVDQTVQQREESPRLHVLSIGVGNYSDPVIKDLRFAVDDARDVFGMLTNRSQDGFYRRDLDTTILLTDTEATREKCKQSLAAVCEKLKATAKPDDLLVIFLAGHGVLDAAGEEYHFVCHGARMSDLEADEFSGTICWDDFNLLSEVPCRKLVFLDTCHSGAVERLRQRYKSLMRTFQEDMIITVAASAAEEPSQEHPDWAHGAFTKSLLEALSGRADDLPRDGEVTLSEIVDYVKSAVKTLTNDQQHPTAAPSDLFPFVSRGVTRVQQTAQTGTSAAVVD